MKAGTFTVRFKERELYRNVTEEIQVIVHDWGMQDGYIHVFVEHTTCTLLLQEDEPCLMQDLFARLDEIAPQSEGLMVRDMIARVNSYHTADLVRDLRLAYYSHDDPTVRTENLEEGTEERKNGHAHVRASLVGQPFLTLRVKEGKLKLGKWQQILFFDFDDLTERRERTISVDMM